MKFEASNSPGWFTEYVPKLNKLFDKYFENLLGMGWISLNFVSKEKIQDLNSRFRKLKTATDVISFPFAFVDLDRPVADEELGEVYVSLDMVKENAKEYKVKYEEEVLRAVIHGSLHVLGYDHIGSLNQPEQEDKEMFEMQEFLVKEAFEN